MKRIIGISARMALLIASVTIGAVATTAVHAQPQTVCVVRDNLVEHLGKSYGESVTAAGVDQAGNLIQVFSSEEGSWTIAITIPGGPTCVLSAGEGWVREQVTARSVEERGS